MGTSDSSQFKNSSTSVNKTISIERSFTSPLADAPACPLLLFFSTYIILIWNLSWPCVVAFCIAFLTAVGWICLGTTAPNRASLPVFIILLTVAAIGTIYISHVLLTPVLLPPSIAAKGTVISARTWGYRAVALVQCNTGKRERFVISLPKWRLPQAGELVSFSGSVQAFKRAKNARAFDEFLYWRVRGAKGQVQPVVFEQVGMTTGFAQWRTALRNRIEKTLPPRTGGYILACVVGERDPNLSAYHRLAGTSHLLAVSGFHVGVIFAIMWRLFRGVRHRLLIISIVLWVYVMLTGAAPSALRAATMLQIILLGRMFGQASRAFNSTCVAGVVLLLFNPWFFWDVGWRMSMVAVLTITALSAAPIPKWARRMALSTLVWLSTSLQAAWTFWRVPFAGILINIFAIPVFALLFPLAIILSLPALIGIPEGGRMALLAEFLFIRWEQFSNNLMFLLPYEIHFSTPFLLIGIGILTYLFAFASGFSQNRAHLACGIILTGVTLLLFMV